MMCQLRILFPLHFVVFKQTACHLASEANAEQVFSRTGQLSEVNLDPDTKSANNPDSPEHSDQDSDAGG